VSAAAKPDRRPRGIRNNNPGNIDYNPTNKWQGLATPPLEDGVAKPRFARFTAPEWGIRAIARLLIGYQDRYRISSVRAMLARYAPSIENDTGSYVDVVARAIGVDADAQINVHEYCTMRPLVEAIIKHENGQQPYPAHVIDEGLRRAGVLPHRAEAVKKSLVSPGGAGAATSTIGAAGAALTDTAQQMRLMAPESSSTVSLICVLLVLIGAGLVVWQLVRQSKGGSDG
jgi:hypothetical protein